MSTDRRSSILSPEDIEKIWCKLEQEGKRDAGWYARQFAKSGGRDLKLGRLMPQKTVGMIYEVSAESIPKGLDLPKGAGFDTELATSVAGRSGKVRISLQLSNPQYRDIFSALCSDVASVVISESREDASVRAFTRRLWEWQHFMQLAASFGMKRQQVRGLFAELCILEKCLIPRIGGPKALDLWQGRSGLQDFSSGSRALEVKSSTSKIRPIASISTLDQLDETSLDSLYLAFVLLNEENDRGESLPDLVLRITRILSDHPLSLRSFEECLLAFGYHSSQSNKYVDYILHAEPARFFIVNCEFPRLRINELRGGILSGKYDIEIDACTSFEITESEALDAFLGDK